MPTGPWFGGITDFVSEDVFGNPDNDTENAPGPDDLTGIEWEDLALGNPDTTVSFSGSDTLNQGPACVLTYVRGNPGDGDINSSLRSVRTFAIHLLPGIDVAAVEPPDRPATATGWEWESDGFTLEARIESAALASALTVTDISGIGATPDRSGVAITDDIKVWRLNPPAYVLDEGAGTVQWPSLDETDFSIADELAAFPHAFVTNTSGDASDGPDTFDYTWDATGDTTWDAGTYLVLAVTYDVTTWSPTNPYAGALSGHVDVQFQALALLRLYEFDGTSNVSRLRLYYSTPRYRWVFPEIDTPPPLHARGRTPQGFLARGTAAKNPLQARSRVW